MIVAGAVSTLPTYLTGSGAAHAVRGLPGVTRELIDAHSNIAVVAAIIVGVLGAFALWVLWRYRRPGVLPRYTVMIALVGALAGSALMAYTGLLGGQIRHTEVRPGFVPPPPAPIAPGDSVGH